MKTKPADVPYCGVNLSRYHKAKPAINEENFRYFVHWIKERYRIHKRKDITGQSPPYTADPILRDYRFTNVRREHDKQTRALIQRVSTNPALSLEDKIVNTFMFRSWNNYETFDFFHLPVKADILYNEKAKETARWKYDEYMQNPQFSKEAAARKWWSAAYNQGGTKYAWKFPDGDGFNRAKSEYEAAKYDDYEADIPLRVFHIPVWLKRDNIVNKILAAKDQQEVYEIIKTVRGFADFLAYQIFVDLTYIPEFPFSENEFTVAGPGCKRGIDYIFDNRDGLEYHEAIFWIRDNFDKLCEKYSYPATDKVHSIMWKPRKLFNDLPEYDQCLNVMSLENCFCEISKYLRCLNGGARPKQRYKPQTEVKGQTRMKGV